MCVARGEEASVDPCDNEQQENIADPQTDEIQERVVAKRRTFSIYIHVPPMEYLLGVADLTGELMRMTIISVGKGDLDTPFQVVAFMRELNDAFMSFGDVCRNLNMKMRVLRNSLQKVENACYNLQVRSSEIPREMLVEMLSANDQSADSAGYPDGGEDF